MNKIMAVKLHILTLTDSYPISKNDIKYLNQLVDILCKSKLTIEEINWTIDIVWAMGLGFGWENPYKILYPKERNNG
jgi:hypothetical protein